MPQRARTWNRVAAAPRTRPTGSRRALGSSRIDLRRAGLYLRGLQIAIRLTAKSASDLPAEPVRDLCYDDNGDSLAPEKTTCEPPEDCLQCNQRDQCEVFEDCEDEVEELENEEELENKGS